MSRATGELERLALRVQLAAVGGPVLPDDAAALLERGLGGLCLFAANTVDGPDGVRMLVGRIHDAGAQALVALDEEGGDVTRLHARTGSPSPGNAVLGIVDDVALTEDTARVLGRELAGLGIDLDLAPVADVNTRTDNPIIGVRSFGSDPRLVARHVAAAVSGLQSAGVAACVKHFPGHGDTAADSHTSLPRVDAPLAVLRERELVPFAAAVDAGVAAVMTSHLLLPTLDADLPATLSAGVLGLLRTELGFDGAIVTDALDMAGVSGGGRGIPRAAVMAIAAGADLLCLGAGDNLPLVEEVREALVRAVREGELAESRLQDAAARVDRLALPASDPAGDDGAAGDPAAAARRALRVEGTLRPLAGALLVRAQTAPTIAVGPVPWGLRADLVLDPADDTSLDRLRRAAQGRPLLVQVRDLHRQHDAARLVAGLARSRPDLTLVEWGWPAPPQLPVTRICTYGASRASCEAVEQLLRESAGWTP